MSGEASSALRSSPTADDVTDPVSAGARGRCPKCGRGSIYDGLLSFAQQCSHCGLNLARFNVGDGAAAFLIFLIGAIVIGLAMWLELSVAPPWWLHVLLWVPLTVIGAIAALRVSKGILLALEYRHDAAEGKIDPDA